MASKYGNLFNVTTTNYVDSNILFVRASSPVIDPGSVIDLLSESRHYEETRRQWANVKWDDDANIERFANQRPRELDTIEGVFSSQKMLDDKKGDRVIATKRPVGKPDLPPTKIDVEYDYDLGQFAQVTLATTLVGGTALGAAAWGTVLTGFYAGVVGLTGGVVLILPIGYGIWRLTRDTQRNIESSQWDSFPIRFEPDTAPGQLGRKTIVLETDLRNEFQQASGQRPTPPNLIFRFMNFPSDIQIANLASQTQITVGKVNNPFSNINKSELDSILNNFYEKTLNQLKRSSQFKMMDACEKALKDTGGASINRQIKDAVESLKALEKFSPGIPEIQRLKDTIKSLKFSRYVIQDFLNNILRPQVAKVFKSNLPENFGKQPTTFGSFMQRFTTYFTAYYDTIEKNESAKKKAGTNALDAAQKKAKEAKKKATIISTREQVDFEKKAASAAGAAQIIRVSGSKVALGGFDTFISDTARVDSEFYSQTQTVLDVFKNDTQNTPLFSDQLAVETNSPANLTSSTDLNSACVNILQAMSPTTRKALITALEGRKSLSLKNIFSALVNIKQLQSDPMFRLSGYFTGFGGISFANFAKLPLGSLDAKSLRDVINIEALKSSLDAATGVMKSIDVGVMANSYVALLSATTRAFTDPFVNAYNSMSATITSVDLKGALKGVSAQDLAKCPSIAQLQNYVYNPNLKGTEGVKLLKENSISLNLNMMQELNKISDQFDELDKIEAQSKRIQDSLNSTPVLSQVNSLAPIATIRQKASSVNLGVSIVDSMPKGLIDNIPTPRASTTVSDTTP